MGFFTPATDAAMRATIPNLSLTWTTPLSLVALLLVVVVATTLSGYRQVQSILLEHEGQRLQGVATLVAQLGAQGATQREAQIQALTREPWLQSVLRQPNQPLDGQVRPRLEEALQQQTQGLAVELKGPNGACLFSVWRTDPSDETPIHSDPECSRGWGTPVPASTRPFVSEIQEWPAGHLSYVVAADIVEPGTSRVLGSLVLRNRVSSEEGTRLLARLIAPDAELVIGNADGSRGTSGIQALPEDAFGGQGNPARFTAQGRARIGAGSDISGTPWAIWVHRDVAAVLAPGRRTLRAAAVPAFIVLLVGSLLGVLASRRLTTPILRITEAAEALSRGDLSRRASIDRGDELGRLGTAFDAMAAAVQAAHRDLERRVSDRTEALEQTLDKLRDAQEELVKQARLATLGQLAGGVGHELRNPLGVMTNAIYFLNAVLDDAPPKVREYLDVLDSQVEISKRIVGDLLDYARVGAAQRERVPVDALFERALDHLDIPPGIEVIQEVAVQLPPAYVDPQQIGQVIQNLATNAVQAMDGAGGVITLRGVPGADGLIGIEVEDNGPGIPEELRTQIFEPLFTTKARGIGLGLAISRSLTEVNGGFIDAESTPGKGTRIRLTLPTAPKPPARAAEVS